MKVILLETLPNLGSAGEFVEVSEGYFRNYLRPKKLALVGTEKNRRLLEQRRLQLERTALKELQAAQLLAERMEKLTLVAKLKAGEDDRLFGAVTTADIAALLKDKGIEVDKKRIELTETLNRLGIYTVYVNLHPEIRAKVKVLVDKER